MPRGPSADPSCSISSRAAAGSSRDLAGPARRCRGQRWEGQEPKGERCPCGTLVLSMGAELGTSLLLSWQGRAGLASGPAFRPAVSPAWKEAPGKAVATCPEAAAPEGEKFLP